MYRIESHVIMLHAQQRRQHIQIKAVVNILIICQYASKNQQTFLWPGKRDTILFITWTKTKV